MKLHANIIGEGGKAFLILHGLFGSGDNWKTLANSFAEHNNLQVHLIDQRNHGRSPHSEEWNYAVMAEDLYAYCEAHSLKKVILMGHSMGGKTVMKFAADYPEMVEALIVVDMAPKAYPPHHDDILEGLSALYPLELKSRREADEKLAAYVDSLGVRQFLLKNLYWKEKGKLAFRMNLPVIRDNYDEVTKGLPEETHFSGPTFFIRGEKSGYILEEDRAKLNEQFPKNQLITIKEAGHWVHAEKPEEFYQAVTGFLEYTKII